MQKKSREAGLAIDYTLIDQAPRFGGKIVTDTTAEGFVIEGGPDSFITQKPWGIQLCRDLGVADRLIPTNDHRRDIFVVNNGRLTPFPGGFRYGALPRQTAAKPRSLLLYLCWVQMKTPWVTKNPRLFPPSCMRLPVSGPLNGPRAPPHPIAMRRYMRQRGTVPAIWSFTAT